MNPSENISIKAADNNSIENSKKKKTRTSKKSNTVILLLLHCFVDDIIYSVGLKNHNQKENDSKMILKFRKIKFYK